MPRGSDPAPHRTETPAGMAARARRLAWGTDDLTVARMKEFAEELERRAAALEQAEQTFTHGEAAMLGCYRSNTIRVYGSWWAISRKR